MKLTIGRTLEGKSYENIGFGETLLDCIYKFSSEKIKEGLLADLYEFYADNDDFVDADGDFDDEKYNQFLQDLHQIEIDERIYSFCDRNNYNYTVDEEE